MKRQICGDLPAGAARRVAAGRVECAVSQCRETGACNDDAMGTTLTVVELATSGPPEFIEWLSGLSAVVALAIAGLVVWRDHRQGRRDQASRISAWAAEVTPARTRTETGATISSRPGQVSVRVHVRNASDAPVYDFEARVRHHYGPDAPSMGSHELHMLPPGEQDVWADWIELPEGGLAGTPYVSFTFKDEKGLRWQRLHTGGLGRDRTSHHGRRVAPRWRRLTRRIQAREHR